jgi:hypothetical protein
MIVVVAVHVLLYLPLVWSFNEYSLVSVAASPGLGMTMDLTVPWELHSSATSSMSSANSSSSRRSPHATMLERRRAAVGGRDSNGLGTGAGAWTGVGTGVGVRAEAEAEAAAARWLDGCSNRAAIDWGTHCNDSLISPKDTPLSPCTAESAASLVAYSNTAVRAFEVPMASAMRLKHFICNGEEKG